MRVWFGSIAALIGGGSLLFVPACGGSAVDAPYENPRLRSGGTSAIGGTGGGSTGGQAPGSGGVPDLLGVGGMYEDLNCPELPPEELYYCDPVGRTGECGFGFKCSPFIIFPEEGECGAVKYGATCTYSGFGVQGDECSTNGDYCADGFLCVVGMGGGARCAIMCDVTTGDGCPLGLFCGETDAQDLGVCY
jgi:hypothetical protein